MLTISGCDVPKDVVWLILREVIAEYRCAGWSVDAYFERGSTLSTCGRVTIATLLLSLQQVCWVFRSVLKKKCVWFSECSFLFKPGSFAGWVEGRLINVDNIGV
jgi:hypothetical protein